MNAMEADPAASPSRPSVRFTALVVPMMSRTVTTAQPTLPTGMPGWSKRVKPIVVCTTVSCNRPMAKAMATTSRPSTLVRLVSPRLRSRDTLIQSSARPTSPAPTINASSSRPDRVKTVPWGAWATRYPATTAATMARPPIVGVPALTVWPWGTSSWMGWPTFMRCNQSIRNRVPTTDTTRPTDAPIRRRITSGPPRPRRRARPAPGGDLAIVEGDHLLAHHLRGLVALAGQQHHVAGTGSIDGGGDGLGAIGEDGQRRSVDDPGPHLLDDGEGVL